MDYPELYQQLARISPITTDAWLDFEKLLSHKQLKRSDFLLQEGEQAINCYILVDGVIRVYFSNDGNEYNKTFLLQVHFPQRSPL
ncbi:MAG: hypothetical protein KDD94_09330 [Calditrichaeota bacterium]|nr:hypothetical protein [Calditrichota bacterium]